MKIKVSNTTPLQLDWLVAKCEGYIDDCNGRLYKTPINEVAEESYHPTLLWDQGGPIIGREGIAIDCVRCDGRIDSWVACKEVAVDENWDANMHYGPTQLIAAMRCYVASKLGDEVEVPNELI